MRWQIDLGKLADSLATGCKRRGSELYNRAMGRRITALTPLRLLGDLSDVDEIAGPAACEGHRTAPRR